MFGNQGLSPLVGIFFVIGITIALSGLAVTTLQEKQTTSSPTQLYSAEATADGCVDVSLIKGDATNLGRYDIQIDVPSEGFGGTLELPLGNSTVASNNFNGDPIFDQGVPYSGDIVDGGTWNGGDTYSTCIKSSMVSAGENIKVSVIDTESNTIVWDNRITVQPAERTEEDWEYTTLIFKDTFSLYHQFQSTIENYPVRLAVPYDECMKTDFSDVRVTQTLDDGTERPLDFYVDPDDTIDGVAAEIWVIVPELRPGSSPNLNVYYGLRGSDACERTQSTTDDSTDGSGGGSSGSNGSGGTPSGGSDGSVNIDFLPRVNSWDSSVSNPNQTLTTIL